MGGLRDENCTYCRLHKTCKTICIGGVGSKEAKLMLVFDAPSTFDDKNNTVMGNMQLLENVLYDVIGIDKSEVYKTYALKCSITDKKKATKKEIEVCNKYLQAEIRAVQPKCIITFGDTAMQAVTDRTKVSKYRGQVFSLDLGDFKTSVVSTYSPYYIANADEYLQLWASDILKGYQVANDIIESVSQTQVIYCDSMSLVKEAISYCKQVGVASFDFETPEIDKDMVTFKEGHHATMLSLSFQVGSAWVIPLEHQNSPYSKVEVYEIMKLLKTEIFENPNVRKIAHNLNYDYHICRIYGITKLRGRIDDTMLMGHLVDETRRKGLKEWVNYLFVDYAGYEDELAGFGWTNVPIKKLAQYNGTDTDLTLRLSTQLEDWLIQDGSSYVIYRNLTMAAFRPLWEAESKGMHIDRDFIRKAIKEVEQIVKNQELKLLDHKIVKRFTTQIEKDLNDTALEEAEDKLDKWIDTHENITATEHKLKQKIQDLKTGKVSAYKGFNFASPKQLEELLYDSSYGFQFDTDTGGTGKDIINDLDDDTGFIDGLLLYRTLKLMLNTYLNGIHRRLDKNDRVHTSLLLSGTVSGRLSSRNPNLQNVPNVAKLKDEEAINVVGMVKKAFTPPTGMTLVQLDYSQAELRIIASFANEETMLKVYEDDGDVHAMTASKMLDVPFENFYDLDPKVQKSGRTKAKAANFGLIYLISDAGFQEFAKNSYGVVLTLQEAAKIKNDFFTLYPKILDYHEIYIEKARKYGWVRTLFGRRRRTPDINSQESFKRGMDERVSVNSPVQGTSGEFTIFAIALLHNRLDRRIDFVNTVHDSILFYIPDDILELGISQIQQTMENLPTKQYFGKELKKVKMKADAEISKESWKDLKTF